MSENLEQKEEPYLIKCTHAKAGRNIEANYKNPNYSRCNNNKFYVKYEPIKQIATVICCVCHKQLFEYKLENPTQKIEVGQPKEQEVEQNV